MAIENVPDKGEGRGLVPIPDPTALTQDAVDRAKETIEELFNAKLESHERLADERLDHIQAQFNKVEEQRVEQKADSKAAIDAALTAQEKAINKTEAAFNTALAAQDTALSKLTEQIVRLESTRLGQLEQRTESRAITNTNVALIGLGVAVLVGFASILGFLAGNL